MADVELTQDFAPAQAGDCGRIDSDNGDNTVNVVFTRRNCDPLVPNIVVAFVPRNLLRPCHCDEE